MRVGTPFHDAENLINNFLKVKGVTNEQARECALIHHGLNNPANKPMECTDDDDITPFTEQQKFEIFIWQEMKKEIINYKFE